MEEMPCYDWSNTGPNYDEEDRQEIINLIRSLEEPSAEECPAKEAYTDSIGSPYSSIGAPLTPDQPLFDERDMVPDYVDDFDAIFSFA